MQRVSSPPVRTRRTFRLARLISATCVAAPAVLACRTALADPTLPTIGAADYNIAVSNAAIDGGATAAADGSTDNSTLINDFISYAAANGGGTVEIPAASNAYLSGQIIMQSGVNLEVDPGATLQNNSPLNTFITTTGSTSNVEISGGGTIDNHDVAAITSSNNMVSLNNVTNLLVTGVTIENSSHEHLVTEDDSNVTINNITIQDNLTVQDVGFYLANTDGIDYSGSNFLIENSTISDGDDDIVAKPNIATSNVLINQDTLLAGHGISVGSATTAGINNLTVNGCTIDGTTIGIHLKAGRGTGGLAQNLTFTNLTMDNVPKPFDVSSYYINGGDVTGVIAAQHAQPGVGQLPGAPVLADAPQTFVSGQTPQWQNLTFSDIQINGTASNGNVFYGLADAIPSGPNGLIQGLTLNNISYQNAPTNGLAIVNAQEVAITGATNAPIQAAVIGDLNVSGTVANPATLTQSASASLLSQAQSIQTQGQAGQLYNYNPNFDPNSVNTVSLGTLTLGGNAGTSGTYNLQSGNLNVATVETVGFQGNGFLYQTGGANNCEILYIGNAGGTGTYDIEGGTFNASVGISSTGGLVIGGGAVVNTNGLFTTNGSTTIVGNSTLSIGGAFSNTGIDGHVLVDGTSTFDVANGTAIEGAGEIEMSGTPTVHTGNYQMLLAVDNFTTVTKAGTNSLTIGGTQAWGTGSELNLTGGTTYIQSNPQGVVNVQVNNATVDFQFTNNSQTAYQVGALNIGSNGHAVVDPSNGGPIHSIMTGILTIANDPGQLDLNDGALIVQDSSDTDHGVSELATLSAYAAAGYNGGAWNGDGLMSSVAAADPKHAMAIGMLNNDIGDGEAIFQQFAGQYVSSGDILARETYYGDGYLTGSVNLDDFDLYLQGLDGSEPATWQYGAYTYSGHVDVATDFRLFALGYYADGGDMNALSEAVASSDMTESQQVLAQQIIIATVPEPGSAALLAIAGFATLSRRHRRRHQAS
jgi:polygalacturonase